MRGHLVFISTEGAGRALGFIAVGKGGEKKRENIFLTYSQTVLPPSPISRFDTNLQAWRGTFEAKIAALKGKCPITTI